MHANVINDAVQVFSLLNGQLSDMRDPIKKKKGKSFKKWSSKLDVF
jgi:hypothetical protein